MKKENFKKEEFGASNFYDTYVKCSNNNTNIITVGYNLNLKLYLADINFKFGNKSPAVFSLLENNSNNIRVIDLSKFRKNIKDNNLNNLKYPMINYITNEQTTMTEIILKEFDYILSSDINNEISNSNSITKIFNNSNKGDNAQKVKIYESKTNKYNEILIELNSYDIMVIIFFIIIR